MVLGTLSWNWSMYYSYIYIYIDIIRQLPYPILRVDQLLNIQTTVDILAFSANLQSTKPGILADLAVDSILLLKTI